MAACLVFPKQLGRGATGAALFSKLARNEERVRTYTLKLSNPRNFKIRVNDKEPRARRAAPVAPRPPRGARRAAPELLRKH